MIPLCDLHAEYLACKQPIDEAIARVIQNSSFILGKEVEQFEKAWAERCGADHCVAVSSCTDALYLTLQCCDKTTCILVPAMTVTADIEAAKLCGHPWIADVDPIHGMITLDEIERLNKKVGVDVVILVHLHGKPHPEVERIALFCQHNNIDLIEDCAHAHGAKVGQYGAFACWSFFPSKVLGCFGDGGAVTFSNNSQILGNGDGVASRLKAMRNHGRLPGEKHFHQVEHGGNYRMDGLQAAILHAKLTDKSGAYENAGQVPLSFFDYCLDRRQLIASLYCQAFELKFHNDSSYYVYAIQHERRDELATFMRERGIATGQHYPVPLHRQPVYKHYGYKCPGADEFARKTLSLPLSPFLSHGDQQLVIDSVLEFGL